jgi:hypothetical protein
MSTASTADYFQKAHIHIALPPVAEGFVFASAEKPLLVVSVIKDARWSIYFALMSSS